MNDPKLSFVDKKDYSRFTKTAYIESFRQALFELSVSNDIKITFLAARFYLWARTRSCYSRGRESSCKNCFLIGFRYGGRLYKVRVHAVHSGHFYSFQLMYHPHTTFIEKYSLFFLRVALTGPRSVAICRLHPCFHWPSD